MVIEGLLHLDSGNVVLVQGGNVVLLADLNAVLLGCPVVNNSDDNSGQICSLAGQFGIGNKQNCFVNQLRSR